MDQLQLFEQALVKESSAERDKVTAAEREIEAAQSAMDFEVHEYSIDFVLRKFLDGEADNENEIYVPDYQRELVWTPPQQSRFIESVFLNLPIPFIFVGDTHEGDRAGHLEIIDGVQRLKTLSNFTSGNLVLRGLKRLPSLNGLRFTDLEKKRRLRFLRRTLRLIQINERADNDMRRELFDRLNSGGTKLKDMEQRRGTSDGPFLDFIKRCASDERLVKLCPLSPDKIKRREYEEMVLRFFAYFERFQKFRHDVAGFLDEYLKDQNAGFDEAALQRNFDTMLEYVKRNFRYGFRKDPNNTSVPRVRFEAIAVGTALALREDSSLPDVDPTPWLMSDQFEKETRSHASNSRPRLWSRLFFVRDHLLRRDVEVTVVEDEEEQWELL